jgi:hypothetical protein
MSWKRSETKRYGGEDPQAKQQRLNQAYRYAKMNRKSKPNLFLMGLAGFSVAAAVMLIIFIVCKNLSM